MYVAIDTRPNLVFSVGLLLRFASNPKEVLVKVVKRIFCYLRATTNIGLTFGGSNNLQLVGYTDAKYVVCTLTRRLTSRYIFIYG